METAGFLPLFARPMGQSGRLERTENSWRPDRDDLCGAQLRDAQAIEKSTATIANPSRSATRCEARFSHDVL